jgi:hypothetical protein
MMRETRRRFLARAALAIPVLWTARLARGQAPDAAGAGAALCIPDGVEFVPRSEWSGSRRPAPAKMRPSGGFNRLTVHHWGVDVAGMSTEKDALVRRMDGLLCSHLSRNYGDIGYHFILDPAGRVWEGRPMEFEGAHVSGENGHNVGVMLLGNFQAEKPTEAQLLALGKVTGWLTAAYSIEPARLFGHCDLASSECPGRLLYPFVRNMREGASRDKG